MEWKYFVLPYNHSYEYVNLLDYIYEHNNEHNISIVGFEIRYISKANTKTSLWSKIRNKKSVFDGFKHAIIIGNIGGDELLTYHYFKMKRIPIHIFEKQMLKYFEIPDKWKRITL